MKNIYEKGLKRLVDIILSLFCLLILSPVMLVIALLVKKNLGSPVLYTQERPGKKEQIFRLFKFRTMLAEVDANQQLIDKAKRLTPFGKRLRSTSLDELPELYNILKGDMSFVGPRPLLMRYLAYYSEEERQRHSVRPGLTGLAQINGRNNLSWEDRFNYDIAYSKQISFKGDVELLFRTIFKVVAQADITHFEAEKQPDFDQYRMKERAK